MTSSVSAALRRFVRSRAGGYCEYCRFPDDLLPLPHEPDHIIAEKHGGETSAVNLAWACFHCNRHKGSDIASVDAQTGQVVVLFDPRRDDWHSHFRFDDGRIAGVTPTGRSTVRLLKFNSSERVELRRQLYACGRWRES